MRDDVDVDPLKHASRTTLGHRYGPEDAVLLLCVVFQDFIHDGTSDSAPRRDLERGGQRREWHGRQEWA